MPRPWLQPAAILPQPPVILIATKNTHLQEPDMTFARRLLQKLGLFAPKVDTTEAFGHRLTRIGTRDSRREVRAAVFFRTPA